MSDLMQEARLEAAKKDKENALKGPEGSNVGKAVPAPKRSDRDPKTGAKIKEK